MTYIQPCADPSNKPDDWFISKDGRQYTDENASTEADVEKIIATGEEVGVTFSRFSAEEIAEDNARSVNLVARRHAKDKCHTECYFRTYCLDIAIRDQPAHGTWGGYYEEELKVLYDEINRRRRRVFSA